jgi:stearoyl-CoA 9-desaturase NADPH oxidoreductase
MAERGAPPKVPAWQARALKAVRSLFTPLLPDDYLELINPLWSTRELRGRIERIHHETENAVTVFIRPGFDWEGHEPGQYLRIGVVIDGVVHWRAYSLTSDPGRPDGCISITPKLVDSGVVSPYFVKKARAGEIVRLGEVEGTFVLPDEIPEKMLFISAGSGVTPIMSMLRALDRRKELHDVVHLHSARTEQDIIFAKQLEELESRANGFRIHRQLTKSAGRMSANDLDELCPDWTEREAFISGPPELLDALIERWKADGDEDRLHLERFQPIIGGDPGDGEGGTIRFLKSKIEANADGGTPILVAGEDAGATLPFGCRMGVCHTCVGRLCEGKIRDVRTGEVSGQQGEIVRTCVNAPEGDVVIDL